MRYIKSKINKTKYTLRRIYIRIYINVIFLLLIIYFFSVESTLDDVYCENLYQS